MFKRTPTTHYLPIVSCPISRFTTSNMSHSSTPALEYPSHASTPYIPQSPQPSDHSSPHLADMFINSRPPTPQLAIRSAGPLPEINEERFLRMQACIISRVTQIWETMAEEAVNNFHNDLDNPTIIERVFNLGTPQAPLMTLVRPLFPEPIPVPPRGVHIIIMQTIPQSPSPLPIYTQDETPPPPPTPSSGYKDLPGAPQIGERPDDDWHHNHDGKGIIFTVLIPNGDKGQQVAPFICIITNKGDPQLEATLGWGCPVTQTPLHAHPDPYP